MTPIYSRAKDCAFFITEEQQCGKPFTAANPIQRYCPECSKLHRERSLPRIRRVNAHRTKAMAR
jgi:hypothetical protein